MSGQHAKLSPSHAATWSACGGALAYAERLKLPADQRSADAAAGTCTHSIAERALRGRLLPAVGDVEVHDGFPITVDAERLERAHAYVENIRKLGGQQFYETRLPVGEALGLAQDALWGTADALVYGPESEPDTIHVVDLKDGYSVVSAQENPQLELYAIGALYLAELAGNWKQVRLTIFQPRAAHYDTATYSVAELRTLADKYRKAANRALEVFELSDAKILAALSPSVSACKWCKARSVCTVRAESVAQEFPIIEAAAKRKMELTDADIAELLAKREAIEALFADLYGEAFARAKAGKQIPGWKIVTGRQGNRVWTDKEAVGDALYDAITTEAYSRALISPAEAQKKLKAHPEVWTALQPLIGRSEGKPELVPTADGRSPVLLDTPEFGVVENVSDLI